MTSRCSNTMPTMPTTTTLTISQYYPARLVSLGQPWLDPHAAGALHVRIAMDTDFCVLFHQDGNLRQAFSDYVHGGILAPGTPSFVAGLLDRALRNRARFALQQYLSARKYYMSGNIPKDHKNHVLNQVGWEVRYVRSLLQVPQRNSVVLGRLAGMLDKLDMHNKYDK